MCGRYTLRRTDLAAAALRALNQPIFEEFTELKLTPRFNAAPSQFMPIVRVNSRKKYVVEMAQWGLVPSWTRDKPKVRPINARSDNLTTSGMYRQALAHRRCLILTDGFYEPKGPKTMKNRPWFFFQKPGAQPFAFGGLWERWKPEPDVEPVLTFTLITTDPDDFMRPIHERMPLVVREEDYDRWLNPDTPAKEVEEMLSPYLPKMECWHVNDMVKRATRAHGSLNDEQGLIEREEKSDDHSQEPLFKTAGDVK